MPIYEYRCPACRHYLSQLVRTYGAPAPACPRCGAPAMDKLVSRVYTIRSEESRIEDLADPASFGDVDENDPRSVARWARRMGEQMGEDLGDEWHEMVDRMEAGELPDDAEGGGPDDMADGGDDDLDT
jgi:putative FmdB family regulatory protein